MSDAEIFGTIDAIINQLTKLPEIEEGQLKKLAIKWSGSSPEQLNPRVAASWNKIIFRGNKSKESKKPELYSLRIEDAVRYLELVPSDLSIGSQGWLDYLKLILKLLKQPRVSKNPTTDGLAALFDMNVRHYSVSDAAAGDYFGYRRSSNSGRIVRFHIKINETAGKGLTTFENTYFQEPDHWVVRGHGLEVGNQSYMLGQARDATDPNTGLGLRFFVLHKLKFGWWSGLLCSLDRRKVPIASRIVVIPVDQHVTADGEAVTDILDYISNKALTPDDLGKQIKGSEKVSFGDMHVPTAVQSLIWNGSVRTLHCGTGQLPRPAENEKYARVFAFQKLALAQHPDTIDDIAFFAEFFQNADVWEAAQAYFATQKN